VARIAISPLAVAGPLTRAVFASAVFSGAALVFLVEPMIAKLILPLLGGSPAVWNTSLAFFQAALLVGYGYAHLLQRVKSVPRQALVHGVLLIAAAAFLPLRVSRALGEPGALAPALWLLGVLTLSIGAPFAALSATAPLVQAWYARLRTREAAAPDPYAL
jgi:glutathione S-transferase